MAGGEPRGDMVPPGGIEWFDVSSQAGDAGPIGIRGGPLGLHVGRLRAARVPFVLSGGRLRGTRCFWSAVTIGGAEVSRAARPSHPDGAPTVHLLMRGEASGAIVDPAATTSGAVLKVIDPTASVLEQFHGTTHLMTLNVHIPLLGMEAKSVTAMFGQSFAMTPFQTALARSAVGLLLAGRDELGSASSLVGLDRHLGALAGLLLRTVVPPAPDREQVASLRRRIEAIIDERAQDPALTPAVVAADLGVSLRQLYRAFSGPESPAALIRRCRLEHAADLLASRHPIGSVEQVARDAGFESAEYFSRAFRREFGLSPRAYRSAHREVGSSATARTLQ